MVFGRRPRPQPKTREYWQRRVAGVNERITAIETRLNSAEFNWEGGIRSGVDPMGANNLEARQELERQLAAARAELDAIQTEARRQNIPAGWVR